jgi:hypothetical protein
MEDRKNQIEPLFERVEEYSRTSYEVFRLKALDKASGMAATFISRGAAILMLVMFTLIANIGIALWLGDVLGKSYYGFFCVAGFYGIIGSVICFFMHNWIKKQISNSVISQMLN